MGKNKMEKKDLGQYISVSVENVVLQNKCINDNNPKAGNKAAKKYIEAFKSIVNNYGDVGRESLSKELQNKDDNVKLMTAAFLLRYKHNESMRILNELVKQDNLLGFSAGETIKRWNEGLWSLDK
jgi:hypothetical protein